jgi:hypothetical protein
VVIGRRRLSLADAITQGIIEVKGQDLTPARRAEIIDNKLKRSGLSQEQQDFYKVLMTLESRRPSARTEGDYTQLALFNKTSQPITLLTSKRLVVGTEAEGLPDVDLEAITASGSANQFAIQDRLWKSTTRKHQVLLKDIGVYSGRLTGEADDATLNAIAKFKRSKDLGSDPIIDKNTEIALKSAALEARDSRFVALTLESTQDAPNLYRLTSSGKELYVGDQIAALTKVINKERNQRGRGNNVYLILKGFPDEKVDALNTSLRIQQKVIDPEISIRPLNTPSDSTDVEEFFFSGGKTFLVDSVTVPAFVASGRNGGYYGSSFALQDNQNRVGTVSVFATLKPAVIEFVDRARTMFQQRGDWSPAKIANVARARLRQKFDLSEDGIRVEFKDQFGRIHLGEIRGINFIWITAE